MSKKRFGTRNEQLSEQKEGFTEENESVEEIASRLVKSIDLFKERVSKEYQNGKEKTELKLSKLNEDIHEKKERITYKIREVEKKIQDLEKESETISKEYANAVACGASDLKAMEERQFSIASQIATYKTLIKNLQETKILGDKEIMNEVKQAYKELFILSEMIRKERKEVNESLKDIMKKLNSFLEYDIEMSYIFSASSIEEDKLVKAYESVYGEISIDVAGNYNGAGSLEEAKRRMIKKEVCK